jgi:hypothetical protein
MVKMKINREEGLALIYLVFVLSLIFTAYSILTLRQLSNATYQQHKTLLALEEAKRAVIGWSALQNNPGQLPCPEDYTLIGTLNEGSAKSSCNTLPAIGRLPWKTLGIGDIRDGNGDKLWYVISAGFRSTPINLNTQAQLTLDGLSNAAVAIIFSPGRALDNQVRMNSGSPSTNQYLDITNNNGDATFISKPFSSSFNDQLRVISKTDLFNVVTYRVLGEVRGDSAQGLKKFYLAKNVYPYADNNNDGYVDSLTLLGTPSYQGNVSGSDANLYFPTAKKTMLTVNSWPALIQYKLQTDQKKVLLTLGNSKMEVAP